MNNPPNEKVNLHTHTRLCKHATGTVRDYCAGAAKGGLRVLGFSEHSPFPDDRYSQTRMLYSEFESYCTDIDAAKPEFPELIILKGLELDVDPEYPLSFYRDELKKRMALDFLSLGVHFIHNNGVNVPAGMNQHHGTDIIRMFVEKTINIMESGLVDFVTHPDMVCGSLDRWTPEIRSIFRDLAEASVATGVPLEINAYGLRKKIVDYPDGSRHPYPMRRFWELAAETGVKCVVGSDAHKPDDVVGNANDAFKMAGELGIECLNAKLAMRIIQREKGRSANGKQ